MNVIFVNKPFQSEKTAKEDLELVKTFTSMNSDAKWPKPTFTMDWYIKYPIFMVKTERLHIGETFHQFLKRKWDAIQYASEKSISVKEKEIEGFFIYDVEPVGGIIDKDMKVTSAAALFVRYDYITKDSYKIEKIKEEIIHEK